MCSQYISVIEARKLPSVVIAKSDRDFCTNNEADFSFVTLEVDYQAGRHVRAVDRKHGSRSAPVACVPIGSHRPGGWRHTCSAILRRQWKKLIWSRVAAGNIRYRPSDQ